MKFLEEIEGVDIYLLDQLMKGKIESSHRVLDAGCGKGRNLKPFIENEMDFIAFDPNVEYINSLKFDHPDLSERFYVSSIENFTDPFGFDIVVCNAVLHFATDHNHFFDLFKQLDRLVNQGGMLFIRMTSNIGMEFTEPIENGVFRLPDNSIRYLITRNQIDLLLKKYHYSLEEPLKTIIVDGLRCMTTLVFRKP